jgi:hypothetical protein
MTSKVIEAVGCKFTEYRGEGMPVKGNPLASPGDIYLVVKEQPYTVWICRPDSEWIQWMSVAESRNCKHPQQERILYPSVQRFAWVAISGYDNYLRQTRLRLGKRNDAADTHVKIILDHEHGIKPTPPQIQEPFPDRAPSPDSSGDDDESEQLARLAMMSSDVVENVPNKTQAEIMAEKRADIEKRCTTMRVQNGDIVRDMATSTGKWYMYELK